MVMGASKVLKHRWSQACVVILEPVFAPVTTKGRCEAHGVEGIGIGFLPPLLDDKLYAEAWAICEVVGTSIGLDAFAALILAKKLGSGKTVLTVACGTGRKIFEQQPIFEFLKSV